MQLHKHPLAKQLMGAGAGTVLAVALYLGYSAVSAPVSAFVSSLLPQKTVAVSKFTDADRAARQQEIADRAREIIERELGAAVTE